MQEIYIMSNISMNIRVNRAIKREAQEVFFAFGTDMTTAVNIFLRQAIRQRGIPFEVKIDTPSTDTLAAMEEVRQMKMKPDFGKTCTDVDEMMRDPTRCVNY